MRPSLRALEPTHYLITMLRSGRGLPPSSGATLEALGLHRRYQSVMHPFSAPVAGGWYIVPLTAGMILKVKELVEVRNVDEAEGLKAIQRKRREGSGLEVTGRVYGGGKTVVE